MQRAWKQKRHNDVWIREREGQMGSRQRPYYFLEVRNPRIGWQTPEKIRNSSEREWEVEKWKRG